ncbi:MAG: MlaD family protein [Desulfobaccales bacterium]
MAKQANRIMIGGFVVVALILMVASLVLFSSGKFFHKTLKFVLYFDESVKGLQDGAPVLFEGVAVGSVVSIIIAVDAAKHQAVKPVIVEIDLDRIELREVGRTMDLQKNMQMLIKEGLRGMLTMQSLITGKLLIELDFYPDTQVNLKNINKRYTEIPTIPSATSKLARALDKLDLEAVQKKLESALEGIAKVANNPDLAASLMHLKETLRDARKLVNRVDRQVDPLAQDTKKTVEDFGKLARDLDARVGELAPSLGKTLSAMRGVISDDAPLIVELENTLQEISAASRSFRQMADYLEQHPEALVRGKGKPAKESGGK